jgi:hypothetical protein
MLIFYNNANINEGAEFIITNPTCVIKGTALNRCDVAGQLSRARPGMIEPAMTIIIGPDVGFPALCIFIPNYSSLSLAGGA